MSANSLTGRSGDALERSKRDPKPMSGTWKVRIAGTETGRGPEVYVEGAYYDDGGEFVVADCGCSESRPGGVGQWKRKPGADLIEANAHLISAARELLAVAKKAILASTWSNAKRSGLFEDARAAIAKATGSEYGSRESGELGRPKL